MSQQVRLLSVGSAVPPNMINQRDVAKVAPVAAASPAGGDQSFGAINRFACLPGGAKAITAPERALSLQAAA